MSRGKLLVDLILYSRNALESNVNTTTVKEDQQLLVWNNESAEKGNGF